MGTFRDDLLPDIDDLRGIAGELGMHRFQVWVRVQVWTGARPGEGIVTTTLTRLRVGGQDPKVVQVRSKDAMAGTAELDVAIWKVGPLTPSWASGAGITPEMLDPAKATTGSTIQYILKGPGLPESGLLCKRTNDELDKPLRYTVTIQGTGRRVPT